MEILSMQKDDSDYKSPMKLQMKKMTISPSERLV